MSKKNRAPQVIRPHQIVPQTNGHRLEMFSGPLPHPDILAKYNDIVPGAADRIIQKFEDQTTHRIQIEKSVIRADIVKSLGGMAAGFIIVLSSIAAGVYTAVAGHPVFGAMMSFSGLALLVGAFATDRFLKDGDEKK